MCLWLLTACLGLLPSHPSSSNVIVVQGVPAPIIQPTTTPAPATTMTASNMTMSSPPQPPPSSMGTPPPPPSSMSTASVTASTATTPRPGTSGSLPIDPRLGTTPMAPPGPPPGQTPQITPFNAQLPTFDAAVRFPRERRSVREDQYNINDILYNYKSVYESHRIRKRQSCTCVPTGTCNSNTNTGGAGQIDIRIVAGGGGNTGQCAAGLEYCCGGTTAQIACGTLQATPAIAIQPTDGQANYGEYPWQALILSRQNDYIAGGVLIDQYNVLTVTHRLTSYIISGTAPNVKVRLGEWDAGGTYEPVPYQEYTIQRVNSHPSYNPNTLQYDITVLRLSNPVPFVPATGAAVTINRACLPPTSTATYVGLRCWVSGWGKNIFGVQGQYQQILKEVDVPIVASATCQSQMQSARLGPNFVLDTTSFICAGGEADKDSCTGDGGSGLVCSVNGQWVVVGLVAWGLGCANANVPAAYVNVAALLPWIRQQISAP